MSKGNILLIEDDQSLGFVVRDNLEVAGFSVNWITNGKNASALDIDIFDACLVDVMLPGMDGFTLAEQIRDQNEFVPILFITARSREEDRLKGFEIGGDDYITKPFSIKELVYRIEVFMRRSNVRIQAPDDEVWVSIGQYQFSKSHLILKTGELSIHLTQREAELLNMLNAASGEVVERKDILEQLWGENDYFKGRSLDVFISRLRKYLKTDPNIEIRNHHGVGFSLIILPS
jgi:two-component system response regulator VicR